MAGAAEKGKLEIIKVALHQFEGGPGVASSYEFYPGDTIFLSFRIAGFHLVEKGEEERLKLSYEMEALDPEGVPLLAAASGEIDTDVTRQDKKKKWTPVVRWEVPVPLSAPSGEYRLKLRVLDEQANTSASQEVSLNVSGRNVEPSDSLVVRGFRFYRSQMATEVLEVPAYRQGESVWARFDMTGYKFGEGNRFHINYGLSVLRPSGKVLFTQEIAADETRESFYPTRHIPGSLSLNLTKDLSKGDYTIVLTVRDLVGDQTFDTKQVFHVE